MYLESAGAAKRQRIDSLAESNITLPSTGAISAIPVDSTMYRDLYSANVLAQCRDVQICDGIVSALGHHTDIQASIPITQPVSNRPDFERGPTPIHHARAPLDGVGGSGIEEEGLEVHQWRLGEDIEGNSGDEGEDEEMSDWADGYWRDGVHWMGEEEEEDEDENDQQPEDEEEQAEDNSNDDFPNNFRGHGGHDLGDRLGTLPTNDKEGTAALIKQSQLNPHPRSAISDHGYLIQIGLLPHPIVEKPGYVSRILRVPTRMTFEKLAEAINTAFDWTGFHLHEFKLCKPCRKRTRCMCILCEPVVAKFNQTIDGHAYVDEWYEQFYTNFDADKVVLGDVWGHDACRAMNMWYRYDFGDDWQHLIHFLGDADDRLGPAMALPRSQEVWCLSGEGHPWPEDMREDWMDWKDRTNLYEWDRQIVNKELRKLKI
ncbi:hypothetical protein D6C87_08743 [Aureobasidium pullulans]|uniref:Plasmid pRiA4b Orf3-like domain-containing protein n=1 Tax=Aureobasidium pullulans TaxID=5580 RepID=A0AB38LQR2_AURPU|nr:hypothetical protein D6C94_07575 [Aureobasidium pullulans]THZ37045.1 hypothetical protein D6C87_08743 [Aureobasidium pullulans]